MDYRISEFAQLCDVNKETVRYYEQKGLLPKPSRTHSGYRIYSDDDIKRMKFIKQLQNLNFTLDEIYKLLGVVDKDKDRCSDMYGFVSEKEKEIYRQIESLRQVATILEELKDCCPNEKTMYACPIIERLID